MFSDTQTIDSGSRLGVVATATWNLRMSLGLPAFFRQFWLHFRKNLSWNLKSRRMNQNVFVYTYKSKKWSDVAVCVDDA
jgi:hypothetical protein